MRAGFVISLNDGRGFVGEFVLGFYGLVLPALTEFLCTHDIPLGRSATAQKHRAYEQHRELF